MTDFPNQKQFDAMNDAKFGDWWDAFVAGVMRHAVDEAEVVAAVNRRAEAWDVRMDEARFSGAAR
jgi:hypothetical protein